MSISIEEGAEGTSVVLMLEGAGEVKLRQVTSSTLLA